MYHLILRIWLAFHYIACESGSCTFIYLIMSNMILLSSSLMYLLLHRSIAFFSSCTIYFMYISLYLLYIQFHVLTSICIKICPAHCFFIFQILCLKIFLHFIFPPGFKNAFVSPHLLFVPPYSTTNFHWLATNHPFDYCLLPSLGIDISFYITLLFSLLANF